MKHVGTRKRRWFLKVELVILVCMACFWAFKSGDVDIDGVTAGVRSANTPATTQAAPLTGDISLDVVVKMAKGGDADAQYNMGVMYDSAQGVPQDYTEAVKDTQSYLDHGEMVGASSASLKTVPAEPALDSTSRKITPRQIIEDHWNLTHKHFSEREKHLRSQYLSIDDYGRINRKMEQLQTEFDDEYLKHKSKLNELVQIQQLIDADMISPEHGFRAQWRIALSDKMYEAMFP